MEKYEVPEMEILKFESEAAVITSNSCESIGGDDQVAPATWG